VVQQTAHPPSGPHQEFCHPRIERLIGCRSRHRPARQLTADDAVVAVAVCEPERTLMPWRLRSAPGGRLRQLLRVAVGDELIAAWRIGPAAQSTYDGRRPGGCAKAPLGANTVAVQTATTRAFGNLVGFIHLSAYRRSAQSFALSFLLADHIARCNCARRCQISRQWQMY
jgi:hypothetical protein